MASGCESWCHSDEPLWQIAPCSLWPQLQDWLTCKKKLCRILVHDANSANSLDNDQYSDIWDATNKFPSTARQNADSYPSTSVVNELNTALLSFCSSCFHGNHHYVRFDNMVEDETDCVPDMTADLAELTVDKIIAFGEEFVRNTFSDAVQEANYILMETRCRRMRLERQRQQNLRASQGQLPGRDSASNAGLQHANKLGNTAHYSSSFSGMSSQTHKGTVPRVNRSLPDIRRGTVRKSPLQHASSLTHGRNNLRSNSSSNVQRRRLERLQRCDARQFSEADEEMLCSAPVEDKHEITIPINNSNIVDCGSDLKEHEPEDSRCPNNDPDVSSVNETLHNDNYTSSLPSVDESEVASSDFQLQSEACEKELPSVKTTYSSSVTSRVHTVKPCAQALDNLQRPENSCGIRGTDNTCCQSCSMFANNQQQLPCITETTSVCRSMDAPLIGCASSHEKVDTLNQSTFCCEYIDKLTDEIMSSAISDVMSYLGCASQIDTSDLSTDGNSSLTSVQPALTEFGHTMANQVMIEALIEAVNLMHCVGTVQQQPEAPVSAEVINEDMQQMADEFVCRVMQEAVSRVVSEQQTSRIRPQMSLDEIGHNWVRPLDNMQRNLAFFDVEFGSGGNIQQVVTAGINPRMSASVTSIDLVVARRCSSDEWRRHRRSSSSSGSSGSSRRSTVLLDFEEELRRSGSIVEQCRAGHDLEDFRRYLSRRTGDEDSSAKLPSGAHSAVAATVEQQSSHAFTEISQQATTTSKTEQTPANNDVPNSNVDDGKISSSCVTSRLHWLAWDLVIEAFSEAIAVITTTAEHVPTKDNINASAEVVEPALDSQEDREDGQDDQMLAALTLVAEGVCNSAMADAIENVGDLSWQCGAAPNHVTTVTCSLSLDAVHRMANDMSEQLMREAIGLATSAIHTCLFIQPRPVVMCASITLPSCYLDRQMAALLHWAAASQADCPEFHYVVTCPQELEQLQEVCDIICTRVKSVGRLVQCVLQYSQSQVGQYVDSPSLFTTILRGANA